MKLSNMWVREALKNGFKDIVPKCESESEPNPKICCMWNWDLRVV